MEVWLPTSRDGLLSQAQVEHAGFLPGQDERLADAVGRRQALEKAAVVAGEVGGEPVAHEAAQPFAPHIAGGAHPAGKGGVAGVEPGSPCGERGGEGHRAVIVQPVGGFGADALGDDAREERRIPVDPPAHRALRCLGRGPFLRA